MRRHFGVLLLTAVGMAAVPCSGQAADGEKDPTIKIVLHPAAEPRPALRYQLLPPLIDRRPGNAALLYCKVPHEQARLFTDEEFWKTIEKWREMPLAELRKAQGPKWIAGSGGILEFLDRGARCESCDWDQPIREQMFWTILLPDIQQSRSSGRILATRARLQIAEGKYDDAVRTFQTGYALGRHVAQSPFLVSGLVGTAITGLMNKQVEEFIQQPDAPNLYWAFASLPRPLIDMRPGFEAEMASVYLSFSDLRDLDKKELAPDQWRRLLNETTDKVFRLADGRLPPGMDRLAVTALTLKGYPLAKRALIERGRSAAEVEAMPVPQMVMIYTTDTYDELRDEMFKWLYLPYIEGQKGLDDSQRQLMTAGKREIIPIASILLPAVQAAKSAEARAQRDMAALQVLEAIRLYGAKHARLPESLKDITDVPVPLDPMRGEPFIYHRDDPSDASTAILEAPLPSYSRLRYQIRFVAKGK